MRQESFFCVLCWCVSFIGRWRWWVRQENAHPHAFDKNYCFSPADLIRKLWIIYSHPYTPASSPLPHHYFCNRSILKVRSIVILQIIRFNKFITCPFFWIEEIMFIKWTRVSILNITRVNKVPKNIFSMSNVKYVTFIVRLDERRLI
jgi:hypothetical protein